MCVEFYVKNGLRYIRPSYTTRTISAKGRWFGKTLIDVLSSEFKSYTREEYIRRVQLGNDFQLMRNGLSLDPFCDPIRSGDTLIVRQHRHEPPVKQWCSPPDLELMQNDTSQRVAGMDIVFEDESILVINKPAGIPVHPTGQFYKNTVTEILADHNRIVHPCYRLDKVTSGLLILSKDSKIASTIQTKISSSKMNKLYLARVRGKFPRCTQTLVGVTQPENLNRDTAIVHGSPIYNIEPKRGFPAGLQPSREATTLFFPFRYIPETDESVVVCKPLTGRTHQIRIHLLRMGFPISNDSLYCPGVSQYPKRLDFVRSIRKWENENDADIKGRFGEVLQEFESVKNLKLWEENGRCSECGAIEMSSPREGQLELWLHAWRYWDDENNFVFETPLPSWVS